MLKKDLLKFMKTLNIDDLPEEFKNEEMNELNKKILMIGKELLESDKTKGEIKKEYAVDDYVIDHIINQMYGKKFKAGDYVSKKLKKQRDITRNSDIADIMDIIMECDNKKNVRFNTEQRIKFAYYMYNNNLIDTFKASVIDNFNAKLPENSPEFEIRGFANKEFGFRIKRTMNYDGYDCLKDFGWLNLFYIDYYFGVRDGKQNNRYQFEVNGERKELKLERAIEVMKILSDNNIPLAECIVQEALKRDLYNELDEFINSFSHATKIRIRVR